MYALTPNIMRRILSDQDFGRIFACYKMYYILGIKRWNAIRDDKYYGILSAIA